LSRTRFLDSDVSGHFQAALVAAQLLERSEMPFIGALVGESSTGAVEKRSVQLCYSRLTNLQFFRNCPLLQTFNVKRSENRSEWFCFASVESGKLLCSG
jgi:hypothetical protein